MACDWLCGLGIQNNRKEKSPMITGRSQYNLILIHRTILFKIFQDFSMVLLGKPRCLITWGRETKKLMQHGVILQSELAAKKE